MEKVNNLYDRNIGFVGPDFARAVLKDIGVEYEVIGRERLEKLPDGPFITISNHPYGSIDGVMLVDLFGHIRPDFKVMVNRFLSRIGTLSDNFICVTPVGAERTAPTRDSIQAKALDIKIDELQSGIIDVVKPTAKSRGARSARP